MAIVQVHQNISMQPVDAHHHQCEGIYNNQKLFTQRSPIHRNFAQSASEEYQILVETNFADYNPYWQGRSREVPFYS